ncbi:MAG TPA: FkbM family methyltransferase [Burkholderiaceae bacterium]|nr:FkbM family methyltransferase [Burkholderiaceae bacterium]
MNLTPINLHIHGSDLIFKVRENSTGDHGVVQQIFQNLDYDVSHWVQGQKLLAYHQEQSKIRQSLIIDAGANIGASVVYFKNTYPQAYVYAIEPEINNWQLLEINTSKYGDKTNFYGAISNVDGTLNLIDPGLSDWGFRTETSRAGDMRQTRVPCISPQSILNNAQFAHMTPLIFKIDIEGAEEQLFDGDTSWMDKFALIVIELHDWMLPFSGSSSHFFKAMVQHDFDFVHKGENVFLFNRRILAPNLAV